MRVSVELKGCAAGLGIRKTVMGEIKEQIIGNRKGEISRITTDETSPVEISY